MNLFINISARKDKSQYKLIRLYARKYYISFEEVVNGIFIPDYNPIDFDIVKELKERDIPYTFTEQSSVVQKLQFAFFENLTLSGIAIFSKNKNFLLKYIIYPVLSIFRTVKEKQFYMHFPHSASEVKQLSFMFDIEFKAFGLTEESLVQFQSYIETQIMKRMRIKKIVR